MAKQVKIDEDECLGCEACVGLCPDIFEFIDSEEKAIVIMAKGGEEDCINEAIDSCPADCITYE